MKTIEEFLSDLADLDIKLWLEGLNGEAPEQIRLRCNAPQGTLTSDIRAQISERKAEIIAFLQQAHPSTNNSLEVINRVSRDTQKFPLSSAQARLWFLEQFQTHKAAYNMPGALKITGSLNVNALEQTIEKVVHRHEVLRTHFQEVNGTPLQIISSEIAVELPVVDLQQLPEAQQSTVVQEMITAEAQQPFDLTKSPLLRVKLLRLGQQSHVLLMTMHHIVSDGWSLGVFIKEISVIYSALMLGQTSSLPELTIQYVDFAVWQQQWLNAPGYITQLNYWKQQLADAPPLLELPTDHPRPPIQSFCGGIYTLIINAQLTQELKALSQKAGVTLFMTLMAGFVTLLYRYSGQNDISVGTPIANRRKAEIEHLIGFFVNTLVLRTQLEENSSFWQLLKQLQQVALDAYAHQDVPFEQVVETLQPERNLSHNPLFQVMFTLQNAPMGELEIPGLRLTPLSVEMGTAKFDLSLSIEETSQGLVGSWEYNSDLFESQTIAHMASQFENLLAAVVRDCEQDLSKLPLLSEAEQHQLLIEWNQTQTPYPNDKCLHQLFEAQVTKTPDAVALVYEQQQLTYQELNARANQLAHYLRSLGVKPETLVGICVERSLEMVVGLLGILKAGGAYVPLDPGYPSDRLSYMLQDAQVSLLLTQSHLCDVLAKHQANVICLDRDWAVVGKQSSHNPVTDVSLDNLAYVIYTSGSTGKPKGVLVTHKGLSNLATAQIALFDVSSNSHVLQFASLSFDASVSEMGMALCSGAQLVLAAKHTLSVGTDLVQLLHKQRITHVTLPPSVLAVLPESELPELESLIVAGEAVSTDLVAKWSVEQKLFNAYGPTEASVCATVAQLEPSHPTPTIGHPIANTQVYILDKHLQIVPIGVWGELHIGGVGLARGYLGRPDLTVEKFIPHPFNQHSQVRLYKTGDLARYLPDGRIEYLGRIDNQVKLRGFRIELGEIEATLSTHPQVCQAVVIERQDKPDNKLLVAYIVAEQQPPTAQQLRDFLQQKLPDYMVPNAFVTLESIPLTPNGKIDRRALPAPNLDLAVTADLVIPQTPTQQLVADIFASVLQLERIGLHNNFFDMGGHSLLATQVISRIREAFAVELPLRTLFESPTVAQLEHSIGEHRQTNSELLRQTIVPLARDRQAFPLSWSQKRLWFLQQLEGANATYNIPSALQITGHLNTSILEQTLQEIFRRHEILRTSFQLVNEKPVQVISPEMKFTLPVVDLQHLAAAEQTAQVQRLSTQEAQQPFDLTTSPLLRVQLLRLAEQSHVLLLTMHHIISDGWSMGVLIREICALYQAFQLGEPSPLPKLSIQYADFAVWQQQWLNAPSYLAQLEYWQQQLADAPPLLELPIDHPRPPIQTFGGSTCSFIINAELTQQLKILSQKAGVTLFMTLLTGFVTLLYRYSGQNDILVGTPIANRTRREIEPLIGFFVNTLVVRTQLQENQSFAELLKQVRQVALDAYAHQDVPFEQVVEVLQPERNLSYNPLFQVMFALQNSSTGELEIPGLTLTPLSTETATAKFDLSLLMEEMPQGLVGSWEYNSDLFESQTISRMASHFENLLAAVVRDCQQEVSKLPLLSEAEQHQLLIEWNQTQTPYPSDKCLHQLFEEQVEKTPNAVALVYQQQQLTYQELNARANQLAHYLRSLGVKPETLVGICVERSLEMVVGLLGILKAGGAYVPLDPGYPSERLSYMIKDAQVSVLLAQSKWQSLFTETESQIVYLDTDWQKIATQQQQNCHSGVTADNLAYVIYTSGSTGQPKGAMNSHRGVCNRLLWMQQALQLTASDSVMQKTPYSFDVSVWEFFWTLGTGARLVMAEPGGHQDSSYLVNLIAQQQITTMHFVPSMLQMFLAAQNLGQCQSLKRIICSGEALPWELQQRCLSKLECNLYNLYGPTEAAIDVTYWQCHRDSHSQIVPIGYPIANIQMYILDCNLQPVPMGVVGELYIGGVGVGRGYYKRAELTAEKFIPNPLSEEAGTRLYKTGDLARHLPDGSIEYIGRIDNQVKLRGLRIELGEIEAALSQHPQVRQNVVILQQDKQGNKRLIGYIVAEPEAPSIKELRNYLKEKLPEYMVPSTFVTLESLPLTPNGKLDRRALPSPDWQLNTGGFVPARTAVEEKLVGIWQQVLGLAQIGIEDNFFEIGGDSIISIQVVSKANQLGIHLTPKQLFQYQTIKELAAVAGTRAIVAEQGLVTGEVPLTPIQHWFWERNLANYQHFNQSVLLQVPADVQPELLEQVLTQLLKHHDALRLQFIHTESGWQQINRDAEESVLFEVVDLCPLPVSEQPKQIEAIANHLQASLNVHLGDLMRVALLKMGENTTGRILIVIHHLAVDGVSWRILLEDLYTAYQQLEGGQKIQLPAKTTSWQQWAKQLQTYAQSAALAGEWEYWLSLEWESVTGLPVDHPQGREANTVASTAHLTKNLSPEQTQLLLQEVPKAYNTQINDVLLTALVRTFAQWTGSSCLLVDLEGHGREELFEDVDISRTVGWFTTIFPVLLHLGDQHHPGEMLKLVKEQLRQVPQRGIGYGILRYLTCDRARQMQLQALPQAEVIFNYLGQFDQVLSQSTSWKLAPESHGAQQSLLNQRSHLLDISAMVVEGQMQISWSYSQNVHHQSTIESLAENFIQVLQSLIEHCQSPQAVGYTPSDFPEAQLTQAELDKLTTQHQKNIEAIYPLSPMQQGMLFHTLYAPESGVYFEQFSYTLEGQLNVGAFQQAWQQVVQQHSVLRTLFLWEEQKQPVQLVCKQVQLPWSYLDWRDLSAPEQQQQLQAFLQADRKQGFALEKAPLMRCTLLQQADDSYEFIWSHHHLLMDGWCVPIVLKEILSVYNALDNGQTLHLPTPRPYKDYIIWLQKQDQSQAEAFWRRALAGVTAPTSLGVDQLVKDHVPQSGVYQQAGLQLSPTLTTALQSLAQQHRLTLNNLVQGAWAILLSRYSGNSDVVFGVTVSGRPPSLTGVESMVGLFINSLPLRVQLPSHTQVLPWLQQLQAQQLELQQYSHSSLVDIQKWSQLPGGLSLFESLVVFENYPQDAALQATSVNNVHISNVRVVELTNYPLTLVVAPGQRLSLQLTYDAHRFHADAIHRMLRHLQTIVESFVTDLQQPLAQVSVLSQHEQQQILVEWNHTQAPYPSHKCLHQLFEEQVAKTPDAVALVYEQQQLTYQELNARANQLAHYLRSLGVKPETLVGICVERSLEMVVGLLAILKAGGAYVPLDPHYPQERLAFVLQDSQVSVLLTNQPLADKFSTHHAQILCLDSDWDIHFTDNTDNLQIPIHAHHLAYVIYTSGSTGTPKGVLVNHANVVRLFTSTREWFEFNHNDVWTLFHSYAFDFSVWELWGALLHGGRLVVVPYWVSRTPEMFYDLLHQQQVTVLNQTPSAFRQLMAVEATLTTTAESTKQLPDLRFVIFGGEALEIQSLRPWFERHGDRSPLLINMYGITETTVHVTYQPLTVADVESGRGSVIGRPIPDLQVYILDQYQQLVPVGVVGEMYVAGMGLARGYLNRPELTTQRFIANPFSEEAGTRLYKTGDLGRYLADGNIEYLGRIDNQVKIRGFRIELGEIEAVLSQHPQVRQAVAVVRQDNPDHKLLIAYILPEQQPPTTQELRDFLQQKLPEYMVPNTFVTLETLPLTPNGKIDRRALPAPSLENHSPNFVAPRNPIELQLAHIWSEVLQVDKVGVQDNFFDLGGHSLVAVRLMAEIQQQFGKHLPLATLFQSRTIEQLATALANDVATSWSPLVSIQPNGSKPPLFCLPGSGGNVIYLHELARYLGTDQPFYGLQALGLDGESQPHTCIEEMAAYYIDVIKAVQPHGPYLLGGHSFGGKVAFEMAQQLLRQGEPVSLVAILDTMAPLPEATQPVVADWDHAKWLTEIAQILEKMFGFVLDVSYETLQPLEPHAQFDYLLEKLRSNNFLPLEGGEKMFQGFVQVFRANNLTEYVPQTVYPVPVALFRASETLDEQTESISELVAEIRQDPAWGWSKLALETVDIYTVPGNHYTMMVDPHVQVLAQYLKACIEKALARA